MALRGWSISARSKADSRRGIVFWFFFFLFGEGYPFQLGLEGNQKENPTSPPFVWVRMGVPLRIAKWD